MWDPFCFHTTRGSPETPCGSRDFFGPRIPDIAGVTNIHLLHLTERDLLGHIFTRQWPR